MSFLGIFSTRSGVRHPEYKTLMSACMDLYTPLKVGQEIEGFDQSNVALKLVVEEGGILRIPPLARVKIPMGLILGIDESKSARLHIRSSVAYKKGLVLANGEAVIDADFREELQLLISNTSDSWVVVSDQERLVQLEVVDLDRAFVRILFEPLERVGDRRGGIGSTGTN